MMQNTTNKDVSYHSQANSMMESLGSEVLMREIQQGCFKIIHYININSNANEMLFYDIMVFVHSTMKFYRVLAMPTHLVVSKLDQVDPVPII